MTGPGNAAAWRLGGPRGRKELGLRSLGLVNAYERASAAALVSENRNNSGAQGSEQQQVRSATLEEGDGNSRHR